MDSWKKRFPEIVEGYDIWNVDETGFFWQALPDRGFGQKGKQCYGGKSKKWVTLASFVTVSGKEKLIFIRKSETPQCLRNFRKSVLPVDYFAQKAWMTGEIMKAVLTSSTGACQGITNQSY